MANVDRQNGFKPVKHLDGSPYNGGYTEYSVLAADGTALFVGDLVKFSGSADADGVPSVIQCAALDATCGAVVGFDVAPADLNTPQYRVASTLRKVYVADNPDLLFEAQADDAIAVADIGLNVDYDANAGSTSTGASGFEVDSSTKATTATLPLKIMGWSRKPDNEGNAANNKIIVKINNHQLGSHTGTAGV